MPPRAAAPAPPALILGRSSRCRGRLIAARALWGLARAYFVGAEEDGRIAVYQGLPYDLGGGVSLYRVRYVSRLTAAQLSEEERAQAPRPRPDGLQRRAGRG